MMYRALMLLMALCLSPLAQAETLKVTVTEDAFAVLKPSPLIGQIEAAFGDTPYALEWVPLPANEVPNRAAAGEFDGSLGSIPVGSPALNTLDQVPVVLFRRALYPLVLEESACPASMDELKTLRFHGVEHFVMFDTAETRLRMEIPRFATLPELIESMRNGDTDASMTFDYTLQGVEENFNIDLKLCTDLRIKSYQFYVYLHQRHANKVDTVAAALKANLSQ